MIVSFLNQKGGSGKTTLTVNVACGLKKMGYSTIVIDTDKQASARTWHHVSGGTQVEVIGIDGPTLVGDLRALHLTQEWVCLDGVSQISSMASRTIGISDVVLIPVQPSPYDVWASQHVVEAIKDYQAITKGYPRAAFVISRKIATTVIGREVTEVLEQLGLPVFESATHQRIIYPNNAQAGLSVFEERPNAASDEILSICRELIDFSERKVSYEARF